jgi:hypothetical protein
MYNQVIATSQVAIEHIVAEDLPVAEKLWRVIRHQVRYMAVNIPLTQVYFSEIFNLRPELGQWVKRANRAISAVIERVVNEGGAERGADLAAPQAVYLCADGDVQLAVPLVPLWWRVDP